MNLNYVVISQPVASLLAYRNGTAVVSLGNNRVALIEPSSLSKAGINPADGPYDQSLAARITTMRDALKGKHVALIRKGIRLYATGIFESPLQVLKVSEQDVDAICEHVSVGGRMTPAMKTVVGFLSRAKHPTLRALFSRVQDSLSTGRSSGGLLPLRSML